MPSRPAQERLETLEALLDLREHDLDRLHAEHAAVLLWVHFLVVADLSSAAIEAIENYLGWRQ